MEYYYSTLLEGSQTTCIIILIFVHLKIYVDFLQCQHNYTRHFTGNRPDDLDHQVLAVGYGSQVKLSNSSYCIIIKYALVSIIIALNFIALNCCMIWFCLLLSIILSTFLGWNDVLVG